MEDLTLSCVYLYRSATSAVVRYVGRGATPDRAASHTTGSHNQALLDFIAADDFRLEIAGPYDSPETAAQVEAALISALGQESKQAAQLKDLRRMIPLASTAGDDSLNERLPQKVTELDEALHDLSMLCPIDSAHIVIEDIRANGLPTWIAPAAEALNRDLEVEQGIGAEMARSVSVWT